MIVMFRMCHYKIMVMIVVFLLARYAIIINSPHNIYETSNK